MIQKAVKSYTYYNLVRTIGLLDYKVGNNIHKTDIVLNVSLQLKGKKR